MHHLSLLGKLDMGLFRNAVQPVPHSLVAIGIILKSQMYYEILL